MVLQPPSKNMTPQMLRDLSDIVARCVQRTLATDEGQASLIGREVAVGFSSQWGGLQVYIPQGAAWLASELHDNVVAEFRGNNVPELAKKYGLSVHQVYQILKTYAKKPD